MSKYQEIQDVILEARKQRDKPKAEFFKWFLSIVLQNLSTTLGRSVTDLDVTDEIIISTANNIYSKHKKTLKLIAGSENTAKYTAELDYLRPYSSMGLTLEQTNFIKEYRLNEEGSNLNLGAFNKALGTAFKQVDRLEAKELYESL
jgi:hypothetical protein